jgi:signal transduction histidine kinase
MDNMYQAIINRVILGLAGAVAWFDKRVVNETGVDGGAQTVGYLGYRLKFLTDLEARIEQAAARVEVKLLLEIDADPMQMRQLMQNLIGNALKFHRQDRLPLIRVEGALLSSQQAQERGYSPHERLCEITVEDNGVGFDPKHADRMFNVFQRLHSRKEFEGTGVGLAICRKIAERHGGRISAKSQVGQGAKFTITLPVTQVNQEQAA